jgi:D-alanine-D-alanine ligase
MRVAKGDALFLGKMTFPAIVKPLNREASEGIAQASVVYDRESCIDRIHFIHKSLNADVIVEEFIHGRELYVGVVERDSGLVALPPRELFMQHLKPDQAMVATYRAKWDDEYRERWGVTTRKAAAIPNIVQTKLTQDSIKIFQSLGMRGYARMDWRMTPQGEPVFLEANPNPALAQGDDFAKAAKTLGLSYGELILTILRSAILTNSSQLPSLRSVR